jgi:hypothetical protein
MARSQQCPNPSANQTLYFSVRTKRQEFISTKRVDGGRFLALLGLDLKGPRPVIPEAAYPIAITQSILDFQSGDVR